MQFESLFSSYYPLLPSPPVDPHVEPGTSIVTKQKQGSSFFLQGLKPWYRRHV